MVIVIFVLLLWAGAIALFYHQWGKINGLGLHQLDYVHTNPEASPSKVANNSSTSSAATALGSSLELTDKNIGVSITIHIRIFCIYQLLPRKQKIIILSFG